MKERVLLARQRIVKFEGNDLPEVGDGVSSLHADHSNRA
jgi:hypothetical protein